MPARSRHGGEVLSTVTLELPRTEGRKHSEKGAAGAGELTGTELREPAKACGPSQRSASVGLRPRRPPSPLLTGGRAQMTSSRL